LQHHMASLMSFFHGRIDDPYPKTIQHSEAELPELRPNDVKRWLAFRAFGDPNPQAGDKPTQERANSLKKTKHGISTCMPNRHAKWIEGRGGNPTQHASVSVFISDVEQKETCGLGKKANDKGACSDDEFNKVLGLFRQEEDFDHKWKYPMMTFWSNHLIHRLDDTCHFKVNDPHGCVAHDFALMTKTRWSKNVRSQKHCPDQIVLASDNWKSCVVLSLANCLEMYLEQHPTASHMFTMDNRINNEGKPMGPLNVNKQHANRVKAVV